MSGRRAKACETSVAHYRDDEYYGRYTVADMKRLDLRIFASLTGGEIAEPDSLLFIDTETTGLSGGAGTVAFLSGVGYFVEDGFVVKQFLMRDFDEEESALEEIATEMNNRATAVSYNGKAFDMNLLSTRFLMNRRRTPALTGHIDLLHVSRRIWRGVLPDCRLSTVEERILREKREGDIPGFEIPGAYFDYLRDGDRTKIDAIMEHNRRDVIAMASLLRHICVLASGSEAGSGAAGVEAGSGAAGRREASFYESSARGRFAKREALGVASMLESLGFAREAERCLRRRFGITFGDAQNASDSGGAQNALDSCCGEQNTHDGGGARGDSVCAAPANLTDCEAYLRLAALCKRRGDYDTAVPCWRTVARMRGQNAPYVCPAPLVELAKYYERRARDCQKALKYTEEALAIANRFAGSARVGDLVKRRERLLARIARAQTYSETQP